MTTPQAAKDAILDTHMRVPQVSNIFDNDASCISNVSPLNVSKYQQQIANRPSQFFWVGIRYLSSSAVQCKIWVKPSDILVNYHHLILLKRAKAVDKVPMIDEYCLI